MENHLLFSLNSKYARPNLFLDKSKKRIFYIFSRGRIDSKVADQIFTNHDYKIPRRAEWLNRIAQTNIDNGSKSLIVDCGANNGLSMKYFLQTYPNSYVVGIEPDAENRSLALLNCQQYPTDISILEKAIGSTPGKVKIVNPNEEDWGLQTQRTQDGESTIDVITVTEILKMFSFAKPFIIKIDIEGFEDDLFSQDFDWIDAFPLLIIELHDWLFPESSKSRNFLRAISEFDRDFVHVGENIFSIKN